MMGCDDSGEHADSCVLIADDLATVFLCHGDEPLDYSVAFEAASLRARLTGER